MTELLQKAFAEASELPREDEDALAQMLLNDLASEQRCTRAFTASHDAMSQLADEALSEFRQGKTKPIELNKGFSHYGTISPRISRPPYADPEKSASCESAFARKSSSSERAP